MDRLTLEMNHEIIIGLVASLISFLPLAYLMICASIWFFDNSKPTSTLRIAHQKSAGTERPVSGQSAQNVDGTREEILPPLQEAYAKADARPLAARETYYDAGSLYQLKPS